MKRPNQNLARNEAAILRRIAAYHGYTQKSGRQAKEGSALAFTLAIVHGDVQTLSLELEEIAIVVPWLTAQATELAQSAPSLAEALQGLTDQLSQALSAPAPQIEAGAGAGAGPIDTMEG